MRFFIISFASIFILWGCESDLASPNATNSLAPQTEIVVDDTGLTLGNPSEAEDNVNFTSNYLIEKPQYTLSYNRARNTANWVAWHLDENHLGNTSRQNDFRPDATLPEGWYQVTSFDYSESGFDRGHLCPSADRSNSVGDNSATFLMSNIMPQAPDLNQGPWVELEIYCRDLVRQGNELYIITGVAGQGGVGNRGFKRSIDSNRHTGIAVPERFWKIILVLPEGENDLERITASTRVIAVDMPNDQDADTRLWSAYRVSVDQLERTTDYDFFSRLAIDLQNSLESKVDQESIN